MNDPRPVSRVSHADHHPPPRPLARSTPRPERSERSDRSVVADPTRPDPTETARRGDGRHHWEDADDDTNEFAGDPERTRALGSSSTRERGGETAGGGTGRDASASASSAVSNSDVDDSVDDWDDDEDEDDDGTGDARDRSSTDGRSNAWRETREDVARDGSRWRSRSGTTEDGVDARAARAEPRTPRTPRTTNETGDDDVDADGVEEDERTRTCRFCFTGSECGTLIEPCACAGSQRFVHEKCLRRWWRVSYHTRGQRETTCRVCHVKFSYESSRIGRRRDDLAWFSLRAKDRLNEYSRAWFQSAANALLRRRGVRLPRSSSSAGNLALLVAHSEVRIWAGREERRQGTTSGLPKLLRVASFFFRAASSYAKLRLLLSPNVTASPRA
jgi:hypothetical protein